MLDIAGNVVAFIVAIGILVTIHEAGHFWVARKLGVKVLSFSVGMGKAIWTRHGRDGVEYRIGILPLGGYVSMLDRRVDDIDEQDLSREFTGQPLWVRAAIIAAGPAANFILAAFMYWCAFLVGITGLAPVVAEPQASTPAAMAGVPAQARITSVDEVVIDSWDDLHLRLVDLAVNPRSAEISWLDEDNLAHRGRLPALEQNLLGEEGSPQLLPIFGLTQWQPAIPAEIGALIEGGAAMRDGVQVGDQILRINNQAIDDWISVVKLIRQSPEQPMAFTLLSRDGLQRNVIVTPERIAAQPEDIGRIGAQSIFVERPRSVVQKGPIEAIIPAIKRTYDMSALTVSMIGKLVLGEASLKNVSGPLTIGAVAGQTAKAGLDKYILFLGLISISLAVLNLLPIPMLDGGHLLYYLIELLTGKPVSDSFQLRGQQLGIVLLGGLMFLAFYNDISRFVQ